MLHATNTWSEVRPALSEDAAADPGSSHAGSRQRLDSFLLTGVSLYMFETWKQAHKLLVRVPMPNCFVDVPPASKFWEGAVLLSVPHAQLRIKTIAEVLA